MFSLLCLTLLWDILWIYQRPPPFKCCYWGSHIQRGVLSLSSKTLQKISTSRVFWAIWWTMSIWINKHRTWIWYLRKRAPDIRFSNQCHVWIIILIPGALLCHLEMVLLCHLWRTATRCSSVQIVLWPMGAWEHDGLWWIMTRLMWTMLPLTTFVWNQMKGAWNGASVRNRFWRSNSKKYL